MARGRSRAATVFAVDEFDGIPVLRWTLAWAGEVDASESPEVKAALRMGEEVDVEIRGRVVGKHFKEGKDGGAIGIATIKPTRVIVNGEEISLERARPSRQGIIDGESRPTGASDTNEILDEAARRLADDELPDESPQGWDAAAAAGRVRDDDPDDE